MPWELRAKKIKAHLVGTILSPGNHGPAMSVLWIFCLQEPWNGVLEFTLAVPALEEKAMALEVLDLCPAEESKAFYQNPGTEMKAKPSIRIQEQKFLVPGSDTIDCPPKGAP